MSRTTKSPAQRARELLHFIGLADRCLELPGAAGDRAYWQAEIERAWRELRALYPAESRWPFAAPAPHALQECDAA